MPQASISGPSETTIRQEGPCVRPVALIRPHDQVVTYAIMSDKPTAINSRRPDLSAEFENILSKALAKNVGARYHCYHLPSAWARGALTRVSNRCLAFQES